MYIRIYIHICNLQSHEDVSVRHLSLQALAEIGNIAGNHLHSLVDLAHDRDDNVRLAAVAALGGIGAKSDNRTTSKWSLYNYTGEAPIKNSATRRTNHKHLQEHGNQGQVTLGHLSRVTCPRRDHW